MARKILFSITVLIGFAHSLISGNIYESVMLNDGSILKGYISQQRPGEDFTFMSEEAVMFTSGKDIISIEAKEKNINDLSPEWKMWAEKNNTLKGSGENRTLTLHDITFKNNHTVEVRLLEKGETVKYLELSPRSYSFKWDALKVIIKEKRTPLMLTGVIDFVELTNNQVHEGQIVEQIPGKSIKILKSDGLVEAIDLLSVIKTKIIKLNPYQNLFEQVPLLDIIQLNNGKEIKGLIVERNIADREEDCFLTVQYEDDAKEKILTKAVKEYRRIPNVNYKPEWDILLQEGEILINNIVARKIELNDMKQVGFSIPDNSPKIVIDKGFLTQGIIVNANLAEKDQDKNIFVIETRQYQWTEKTSVTGFTFMDIIYPSTIERSINNMTKLVFRVEKQGLYVLYLKDQKKAVLFEIK